MTKKKRRKKPYFHNNVEAIRAAPAEYFRDPHGNLLSFDEFMDWKCGGYSIPATVLCIIKEYKPNGKVKEHTYQRGYAANRKIKQMIMDGHEFSIVDNEGCQQVIPTLPTYNIL
jgi:hypothetical protein